MAMKQVLLAAAVGLALMLGAGCESCSKKPSEAECRAAIENVRDILGLQSSTAEVDIDKAIRSCRGSSTKDTAKCLASAKTEEDLAGCEGDVGKSYLEQEREAERKRREKAAESEKEGAEEKKDGE